MSEEQTTIEETTEVTETPEVTSEETSTTETEPATEEAEAPAEEQPEGTETQENTEQETEEDPEKVASANQYKPNLKFKASVYNKESRELEQKEYDIDKRFHSLMKDEDSEKAIRELHEKAYGLDSVKERFNEARATVHELSEENRSIKSSIDGLRKIYRSSVETNNPHKLDAFFERLKIPQDVILNYALAKVQLQEMDPTQRQAILGNVRAEQEAEELREQQAQLESQNFAHVQQLKRAQLDTVLIRPEVQALADAFDKQVGKPGLFKQEVIRQGELAWYNDKKDLTPEQAVQAVISYYNLTTNPTLPNASQQTATQTPVSTEGKKPIVQRTTKAIPNISGRTSSPLKNKPKSVDDLKKIYNEKYTAQQQ